MKEFEDYRKTAESREVQGQEAAGSAWRLEQAECPPEVSHIELD